MEARVTVLDSLGFSESLGIVNMRISVTIFVILISTCIVNASVLDPVIENVVHLRASKPPTGVAGIWKKKTIWKPRWVKEWKSAKVMKPVWKKIWSPVQIREWVPIPKPPPGWDSISTPLSPVHPKGQKAPIADSAGHDSYAVHTATKIPLWDPIPYPESQQPPPPPPPPPPIPRPLHNADSSCGKGNCEDSHSATTFNHQQISEIIGQRQNSPEYYQNEYSETVNHLTRLPPEGNNWKAPPQEFQPDNRFNNFPGLPDFLVPPTFPQVNDFQPQLNHYKANIPTRPDIETSNNLRQFPSLSSEVKFKEHSTTRQPDHPYKFQLPELQPQGKKTFQSDSKSVQKPNSPTHNVSSFHPLANSDFIQEAQLVEEYHYSEFDSPNVKQSQQDKLENVKEQQKVKPDIQKVNTHHKLIHNQTEKVHPQNPHIQKKHISHFSSESSNHENNIQQQKAILKEIFPMYNIPSANNTQNNRLVPFNGQKHPSSAVLFALAQEPNFNSTNYSNQRQKTATIESIIPSVYRSSQPITLNTNLSNQQQKKEIPPNQKSLPPSSLNLNTINKGDSIQQQQKENYPIYEIPHIPHNHRFSAPTLPNFKPIIPNENISQEKDNKTIQKISPLHKFFLPTTTNFNASTTNTGIQQLQLHGHRFSPPNFPDFKPLTWNKTFPDKNDNYPTYENPQKFDFLTGIKLGEKSKSDYNHNTTNYTTKLLPIDAEKNTQVHLVYPTAPDEPQPETQNSQKTTTTEPYSVIFSSSLLLTTEAVTQTPLIIVTPTNQNDSDPI